jgi:mannose-6-phosphate isomerase-like protein (cupin superfamily)
MMQIGLNHGMKPTLFPTLLAQRLNNGSSNRSLKPRSPDMTTDKHTPNASDDWQVFQLDELVAQVESGHLSMREFLRTPSLSCSIYHVPVGSRDMASAHEEDELYLVLSGRARLRVGTSDHEVRPGTLMYVRAACDHSFFDVEEHLTVLAFFGTSLRQTWVARKG